MRKKGVEYSRLREGKFRGKELERGRGRGEESRVKAETEVTVESEGKKVTVTKLVVEQSVAETVVA